MYTFHIRQKDRTGILSSLHIIIALIFLFDFANSRKDFIKDWVFSSIYLIAALFLLLAGILSKKLVKTLERHLSVLIFESVLLIGGAIYFWSRGTLFVSASHALMGGAVILFWIYLKKIEAGEKIVISELQIILPGLFTDRIVRWSDLTNVVKKEGLLTMDFKNNKILQVEVNDDEQADEATFNQFCKLQLSSHNN